MTDSKITRPGVKRIIGVDLDLGALKTASPRYWAFVSLLLVVATFGLTAWGSALGGGGGVMGMRDSYPWGLWFVNYMYYVGLAAGGLIVYAAVHLFGAHQFHPLSRIAVLQAGVLVMMALLGIITDMERPWRAVWMLVTPNPTSPFVYTGSAATIYMLIAFFDLWVLLTGWGGEKLAFRLTLVALPLAIYMHTTTAFVLSMNKSRELWNSAVMVPIFLTSATASGVALLMIFAYTLQHFGVLKFKSSMFRSLSTLLATVMIIDLFLLVVEVIAIFWPTSAQPGHAMRMAVFFTGGYAWAVLPVFVLGFTAFFILQRRKTRHLPIVQLTASGLYVVAVYFKRYSLMAMGFAIDPLGQHAAVFVPSLTEVGIALFILSLGLLTVTAAAKVLPLEVPEHGDDERAAHGDPAPEPVLEAEVTL
ncbi:MAG: NrfD/PsrC family molybdoenzyme membrane anchor subunit [Coriobacteriia bacterium]|nr:NrfD/PsrC family molybdoenzyme membrane anchor subunit [Coriobacteriia bacterium]